MRKIVKNEPRRPLPAAVGAAHWTRSGPVLVPNAPPADWNSTRERATPIGVPLHRIYGRSDYIPRNQKLRQMDSCFQGRAGGGEKENITLSVRLCVPPSEVACFSVGCLCSPFGGRLLPLCSPRPPLRVLALPRSRGSFLKRPAGFFARSPFDVSTSPLFARSHTIPRRSQPLPGPSKI